MSIVRGDVDDYVKHVSTADEAARLDDDLAESIDALKGKPGAGAREAELKAARRRLQGQHPEILERAFGETASGKPRPEGLGPRGKALKRSGAATTRTGRNQPKRPPRPASRRSQRRVAASSSGRRGGGRGPVGRAWEQTGVPGAARGATANALEFFGILIGLSIAYLLLSNAQRAKKGRSAVELVAGGVAKGVSRVVSTEPAFGAKPADLTGIAGGVAAADEAVKFALPGGGGSVVAGVGAVNRGVRSALPRAGTVTARGREVAGKTRVAAHP